MIRKILVPLDGSELGEHALPLAASLAKKTGAMLHLAHVHQPSPPIPAGGLELVDLFDVHLRQDEEAYLADVARRVREQADVPVSTFLLEGGEVARLLREYAETADVEMVVMATHGRGTLGRWWLGSVADELARSMPRPVVMIRPEEGKADLSQKPEPKCVLVALDGSKMAEEVLEPAAAMAQPFGAEMALVRVCPPVIRASYLPDGTSLPGLTQTALDNISSAQKKAVKECREYLDGIGARLRKYGMKVTQHVVIEEDPAAGILAAAKDCQASIIALETHGRVGLSRLFMGSVADRVVRGGGIPVLINRPAAVPA
jgi:nucleotide-binding universal stress UspA family protein